APSSNGCAIRRTISGLPATWSTASSQSKPIAARRVVAKPSREFETLAPHAPQLGFTRVGQQLLNCRSRIYPTSAERVARATRGRGEGDFPSSEKVESPLTRLAPLALATLVTLLAATRIVCGSRWRAGVRRTLGL